MARCIFTKVTIDELIESGRSEYRLGESDIVTGLAAEYAQQRNFRLIPFTPSDSESADCGEKMHSISSESAGVNSDSAGEPTPDKAIVRKAVIAALGYEPSGLDMMITKVMS